MTIFAQEFPSNVQLNVQPSGTVPYMRTEMGQQLAQLNEAKSGRGESSKTPDDTQEIQKGSLAIKEEAAKEQPANEQAAKEQAAKEQAATKDYSEAAIVFWVVVLGIMVLGVSGYWWFAQRNRAVVFLQASATQPLQISGAVMFKGTPVSKGTVSLVLDDPKEDQYLAGKIFSIDEGGEFRVFIPELVAFTGSGEGAKATAKPRESPKPLRVTATFSGQAEKKDKSPTAVTGKATLYLHYSPPMSKWITWGSIIVIFGMGIFLVTLFTGEMTQRKARLSFSTSYLVIFLSLALPICGIVSVSRSPDTIEVMQQTAIGLVKGTARGISTPQWIVNLGGAVSPATTATITATPTPMAIAMATAQELPTGTEGNPPQQGLKTPVPKESVVPVSPKPAQEQSPAPTPTPAPIPTQDRGSDETLFEVKGGLAVPFYVIFLAMLGAGINMTKKVPDIQRRHDIEPLLKDERKTIGSVMVSTLMAPGAVLKPSEPRAKTEEEIKSTFGIRAELIDNYMGLISAPFLAIAVYYLLQVVSTNVTEPVLVVVSFATGFISDSIVTAITDFAGEMIKKKAPPGGANGQETSGQKTSGQAANGQAVSGQAASDQGASDQGASSQGASGQAATAKQQATREQPTEKQMEKKATG